VIFSLLANHIKGLVIYHFYRFYRLARALQMIANG
jgi:hypothetical protein